MNLKSLFALTSSIHPPETCGKMARRGSTKKRRTQFRKGHGLLYTPKKSETVDLYKRIVRVDDNQYQELTGITSSSHNEDTDAKVRQGSNPLGNQTAYLKLRPRKSVSYLEEYMNKNDSAETSILVDRQKFVNFWNTAMAQHKERSPKCDSGFVDDPKRSARVGAASIMALKCKKCGFLSERAKLYDEVACNTRGRKAAGVNVRLQTALTKNGIGNTAAHHILTALNMNPPSKSGLMKTSNKVADKIVDINIADMRSLRGHIKKVNLMRGRPAGLLDAEADATYNHRFGAGRPTPTQPATQATYLFVENVTSSKKIINCKTYSRLCICDTQDKQGPHTKKCKANLAVNAVIGNEKLYLAQTLAELYDEDFSVEFMTLDGDSSARSLLDSLQQPDASVECKVQYCTRHLNRIFMNKLREESFSAQMFTATGKAEKTEIQKLLALDMANRAQAEFNMIFIKHGNSLDDMIKYASYIPDAVMACYSGKCERVCWAHSFACSKMCPWRRTYLSTRFKQKAIIKPTFADRKKLRALLDIRFSRKAVIMTQTNSNQNKCEAANRGLAKAAPKSNTFPRNYAGRIHSAVHSMNHSPGESTVMIAEQLGAPFPCKSPAVKAFQRIDHERSYHQEYQRSHFAKRARKRRREEHFRQCYARKYEEGYKKAAAVVQDICPSTSSTSDHVYSRPTRQRRLTVS